MMPSLTNDTPFPLRLVSGKSMSTEMSDRLFQVTCGMRAGDDDAWNEFHRRYYFGLLRYATTRLNCAHDPAEIVQLAYLRIARHIKPFTSEQDFWRWLACVVRCTALDHQRGVARRTVLLEKFALWRESQKSDSADALNAVANGGRLSIAEEALAQLSPDDAQLLRLKYYEGWSVNQLAATACTTPKAIENRLARIRERLRGVISQLK